MKVLRIVLTQNKAHYRKEETERNKMTYPLPPFSTIIGALHNACSYDEYHSMNISVQGSFGSMINQPYTDHCFLDSIFDDRGILVKLNKSNAYSSSFQKVAEALKPTGNSFRKGITIGVYNQDLLKEYRDLKDLSDDFDDYKKDKINNFINNCKKAKKRLADKKKKVEKKTIEYVMLALREEEIKSTEKKILENFNKKREHELSELSKFKSLTTSLKYYEILCDVKLTIHISSEEIGLLEAVKDNIYNLKALGRSEDFVDVVECEVVELRKIKDDEEIECEDSFYVNCDSLDTIMQAKNKKGIPANGTKYYLPKNYSKENGYRKFERKKVLYTSNFIVDDESEDFYVDEINGKKILANFS